MCSTQNSSRGLGQRVISANYLCITFNLGRHQYNCENDPLPICKWTREAIQVPPDSTPADLIIGALKLKQRRVFCACLQVFFKHCFSGSFSLRFRPTAGDTITCPCSDPPLLESGMAPRPTRDSITPIVLDGGDDLHADPLLDFGSEDGFLPPLLGWRNSSIRRLKPGEGSACQLFSLPPSAGIIVVCVGQ